MKELISLFENIKVNSQHQNSLVILQYVVKCFFVLVTLNLVISLTGYAFIATDTYKKKKMVSSAPQKILFHKPSPL